MLDSSHAERVLSLFTAPERAASIVGDLAEESRSRGKVWFWRHVIGTAFALCMHGVAAAPRRALLLGAAGFALYFVFYLAAAFATGLFGFLRHFEPSDLDASLGAAPWGFWLRVIPAIVISNLVTGMALARYGSTGSMNGTVPLVVLWLAMWLVWPLLAALLYSLSWYWIVGGALTFPLFYLLPVVTGGAIGRSRTLAR